MASFIVSRNAGSAVKYREHLSATCPQCALDCDEITDPFGYFFNPPAFMCSNCERGDGVDAIRGIAVALGPLTFTLDESQQATAERLEE